MGMGKVISWETLAQVPQGTHVWYRDRLFRTEESPWGSWREGTIVRDVMQAKDEGPMRWVVPVQPSAMLGMGLKERDMKSGMLEVVIPIDESK